MIGLRNLLLLIVLFQTTSAVNYAASYGATFSFVTNGCAWQPIFEFGCPAGALVVDSVDELETDTDSELIIVICLSHPNKGSNFRLCSASQLCSGCAETPFHVFASFRCEGSRKEALAATTELPVASAQCNGIASAIHAVTLSLVTDPETLEFETASSCDEGVLSRVFDDGLILTTCAGGIEGVCLLTCTSALPAARASFPASELPDGLISDQGDAARTFETGQGEVLSSSVVVVILIVFAVLLILAVVGISFCIWCCCCCCRDKPNEASSEKKDTSDEEGHNAPPQSTLLTTTNTLGAESSALEPISLDSSPGTAPTSTPGFLPPPTLPHATAVLEQQMPVARVEIIPPSTAGRGRQLVYKNQVNG